MRSALGAHLSRRQGVDALFNVNVEGDVGIDPDDMILWISQPEFGLPSKGGVTCRFSHRDAERQSLTRPEYYKEDAVMSNYTIVVKRLLVHLDSVEQGLHPESATLKYQTQDNTWSHFPRPSRDEDDKDDYADTDFDALAKAVVHFEKRLVMSALDLWVKPLSARIVLTSDYSETLYLDPIATYNPMPLQNFTRKFPQLDFPAYFAAFAPRNFPARVVVTSPAYITALSTILDETSAEVLEAYLVARAALVLAPLLSPSTEAWRAQRSLQEMLEGLPQGVVGERSEFCVDRVEVMTLSMFGWCCKLTIAVCHGLCCGPILRQLDVRRGLQDGSDPNHTQSAFGSPLFAQPRLTIRACVDVIEEMKRSLADLEWMDQESAAAAVEKVASVPPSLCAQSTADAV
jgi:predicted metalloendopeptidase